MVAPLQFRPNLAKAFPPRLHDLDPGRGFIERGEPDLDVGGGFWPDAEVPAVRQLVGRAPIRDRTPVELFSVACALVDPAADPTFEDHRSGVAADGVVRWPLGADALGPDGKGVVDGAHDVEVDPQCVSHDRFLFSARMRNRAAAAPQTASRYSRIASTPSS